MDAVYTDYFQKSKVFLYPLLKLKKGLDFVPVETYVSWDGVYETSDYKFICVYKSKFDEEFIAFQLRYLNYYKDISHYDIGDEQIIVFDMSDHTHDYDRFLEGRYSAMSMNAKITILDFFGGQGRISMWIKAFLSPEETLHKRYAAYFDVDIETIADVYELCSVPDLIKETLYCSYPIEKDLENSQKSLSLEK